MDNNPNTPKEAARLDDFNKIFDIASALGAPRGINDGTPFVVIPNNYKVQDLERYLPQPLRKRGRITTTDMASFIEYVNKHSQDDASTIYSSVDSEKFEVNLLAILDDNSKECGWWREHFCHYDPKNSVEFSRWTLKNGVKMSQVDFATWLEDNLGDIASVPTMPTGQEILTMALGFEANSDKKLRSKVSLQSGGFSFEFVDKENDATRSTMKVFERFTIGVPVFDNSPSAYPIEARMKYREKDGSILFWYELIRPDRAFKQAVNDELSIIGTSTSLTIISGKAGV